MERTTQHRNVALRLQSVWLAALLAACGGGDEVDPNTNLRVVNLSYDSVGVDVRVEGMVDPLTNIGYGKSSGYHNLAPGRRSVRVLNRDSGAVLGQGTHRIEGSADHTIFLLNKLAAIEQLIVSDARQPGDNTTKLRLVNAVADAPGLDLHREGATEPVLTDVQYKNVTEYREIEAGLQTLFLTRAGKTQPLFRFQPRDFNRNKVFTIITAGTFDEEDDEAFIVYVLEDLDQGLRATELELVPALLGVVHASEGADRVNVVLDGEPINEDPLAYGQQLTYQELRPGRQVVEVRALTADALLTAVTLTLASEEARTIFVANEPSKVEAIVVTDDLSAPPNGKAKLRVAHMSPGTPLLNVRVKGDTANLASNLDFKQATAFVVLPAQTKLTFELIAAASEKVLLTVADQSLDAGGIYTLLTTGTQVQSTLGTRMLVQR